MLSHKILTRSDIGRAANYYEDGADDYYAREGEATQWQGKGAEDLGLSGAVDKQRLRELFAGQVSEDQYVVRSSTRHDSKTRIGIDFTFSAPKSVSIQALVHGDARIIQAHDRAVAKAMEAAEARAQARHKTNGRSTIERTGNLVIAKFRHETSRAKDPQLHTHAVVMNVTRRADGQWRALRNDEIVKATKYLGAVYRAELAAELQKQGYQLRQERDGAFELAHISRKQLEAFSQRSAQVEQKLQAQGLTRETATSAQKQAATMQSRAKKDRGMERQTLHQDWKQRAAQLGIDFERRDWAGTGAEASLGRLDRKEHESGGRAAAIEPASVAATRAVRFAINHLTERQAVMQERELIDVAMKHSVGSAQARDIEAAIQREEAKGFLLREDPRYRPVSGAERDSPGHTRAQLVDSLVAQGQDRGDARRQVEREIRAGALEKVETRFSTQTALEREKRILQIERTGRDQVQPILTREAADARFKDAGLTQGQREAATLMATSTNRIVGIQGSAGTGKSHMLDTAKKAVEEQGYIVRALAPYATQVKALRELGVPANTVASFLHGKDKTINERTVLVIDEAGVMPTRLMEQTIKLAERTGARVVLMGDVAQTKAIEAGRPFEQLQRHGMETARMAEIQRQKNPELKKAVELVVEGNAVASLSHISTVKEISDPIERQRAVAAAYVNLPPAERENTLIVSGTNDARRHINETVREALGTVGKGIEYDTLIRRDTTQAERRHSSYYNPGDVIQPERDYAGSGLKRGELYTVTDTGPGNRLTVQDSLGHQLSFSPMTHRKLSVYEPERTELAPGDVVRVTRNNAELDLANGQRLKVLAVRSDQVTLTDGTRQVHMPANQPLHLDHAHATTVHSAQGLTSDKVLIDANSRSLTTATDVYYVAISRARHEAQIYTDDRAKLPAAISKDHIKHAALDLARDHSTAGRDAPQRHDSASRHDLAQRLQEVGRAQRNEHEQRPLPGVKQERQHSPYSHEATIIQDGRTGIRLAVEKGIPGPAPGDRSSDKVRTPLAHPEGAAMQRNILQRQFETGKDQMHYGPGQSSYNPSLTGAASQRNLTQRLQETGRAQTQFMNDAKVSGGREAARIDPAQRGRDLGTQGQQKARDKGGPEFGT